MSLERARERERDGEETRRRDGEFEPPDETGDRVLEYLFDTGSALPAPAIAWNLSGEREGAAETDAEIARRLARLERAGLVERVDAGRERPYYRVTRDGVAYLGGLFDPAAGEGRE